MMICCSNQSCRGIGVSHPSLIYVSSREQISESQPRFSLAPVAGRSLHLARYKRLSGCASGLVPVGDPCHREG